jgi:hypothetical protein
MEIFLDYYHPYAGLCNQLYLITNHIHQAYLKNSKIYINKVNIDIFKKERIFAFDFFDLTTTNANLKKLLGKELLLYQPPLVIGKIPKLCIYPVSSIEILNCLEFKIKIPKIDCYGVHFRLDLDAIVHYLFEERIYNQFMIEKHAMVNDIIKHPEVNLYIDYLMNQYFILINQIGFDKPWYICTSIGKNDIHNVMLPTLYKLTDFIRMNGGSSIIPPEKYPQRELNALVDLLNLRDSVAVVGFEGSSFSEGYCYKVDSIRNPTKRYVFVNGIVNKVPF